MHPNRMSAAVDLIRRNGASATVGREEDIAESIFDTRPGPRMQASEREMMERVTVVLRELPDKEGEAIVLHLWSGLKFREIADAMGHPQGTVTSWYQRGLRKLREKLNDE